MCSVSLADGGFSAQSVGVLLKMRYARIQKRQVVGLIHTRREAGIVAEETENKKFQLFDTRVIVKLVLFVVENQT